MSTVHMNALGTNLGSRPLFRVPPNHDTYKLGNVAKSHFVHTHNNEYAPSPLGALRADPRDDSPSGPEDKGLYPLLLVDDEEDYSADMKGVIGNFKRINLGVGWPNGEKCRTTLMRGCIIQNRTTAGKHTGKKSLSNRELVYGETFLMVGVPTARIQWIKENVEYYSPLKLDMTPKPKSFEIDSDYVWITCNLPATGKPIVVMVVAEGQPEVQTFGSLTEVLQLYQGQNLTGLLGCNISLKPAKDSVEPYAMSLNISPVSFQLTGTTNIMGPQIGERVFYKAMVSTAREDMLKGDALEALRQAQRRSGAAPGPTQRPVVRAGNTASSSQHERTPTAGSDTRSQGAGDLAGSDTMVNSGTGGQSQY